MQTSHRFNVFVYGQTNFETRSETMDKKNVILGEIFVWNCIVVGKKRKEN